MHQRVEGNFRALGQVSPRVLLGRLDAEKTGRTMHILVTLRGKSCTATCLHQIFAGVETLLSTPDATEDDLHTVENAVRICAPKLRSSGRSEADCKVHVGDESDGQAPRSKCSEQVLYSLSTGLFC